MLSYALAILLSAQSPAVTSATSATNGSLQPLAPAHAKPKKPKRPKCSSSDDEPATGSHVYVDTCLSPDEQDEARVKAAYQARQAIQIMPDNHGPH